jgi:ABC-2 type transport system ATP-binding protein
MTNVIELEGLRKEYRRFRGPPTLAIDRLDLAVPEGGVFGFLGPNGAGKTTLIRCLLGLAAPTSGRMRLLGADLPHGLPHAIRRTGSVVETPAMFPKFTGRRNLEILGRLHGIGAQSITRVLDVVGLAQRADDRVKTYSLGMRQRLGIAAALLKDPAVMILDEPANGLDPAGIVEVRDLLRRLGQEGRTVFVSSHILSEIQHTADRVAIIAHGRLVATGTVDEVLASRGAEGMLIGVRDLDAARAVLAAAAIEATPRNGLLRVDVPPTDAELISRTLAENGLFVTELRPDEIDLETVFLELTSDEPREAGP